MKKFFVITFLSIFLFSNLIYAKEINQEVKKENCSKCTIEDDEYCIYNECYLNNHFRNLKKILCLTEKQEKEMDNVYQSYKEDIGNYFTKYRIQKNKILEQIECQEKYNCCILKNIKKDMKDRTKSFELDIKDILCKNQFKDFKKQKRIEIKIFKKILKYGKIYKLPCNNCKCKE